MIGPARYEGISRTVFVSDKKLILPTQHGTYAERA